MCFVYVIIETSKAIDNC